MSALFGLGPDEGLVPEEVSELADKFVALGFQKTDPQQWLAAGSAFIGIWVLSALLHAGLRTRFRRLVERTDIQAADVVYDVVAGTRWYFHAALALTLASRFVNLTGFAASTLRGALVLAFVSQLGIWVHRFTRDVVMYWASRKDSARRQTIAGGVTFFSRLVIWLVILFVALRSLGFELRTLLAGLGVGGVAAALAVQNILGDVFAGLSMYFDRPFDIGDVVEVDEVIGTVTQIGLRTTRLRSIDGEEIVIPNGELAQSRIQNFARLEERRVVFDIGIEYGVSAKNLERARELAEGAIEVEPLARLDHVHFKDFGVDSLDFEVVFFVLASDIKTLRDVRHRINLEIYRRFEQAGIPFGSRTHVIYHRGERAPLDVERRSSKERSPSRRTPSGDQRGMH